MRLCPTNCGLGYEPGDAFASQYCCPEDFCPKTLLKPFPILEATKETWVGSGQRCVVLPLRLTYLGIFLPKEGLPRACCG